MEKKLLGCLILCVFILNGCAVGNVYNFSDTRADLQVSPAKGKSAAVAAHDQRVAILSGECVPAYVGLQRAGFGNPWRVNTESGLPLADDLTKAVSETLLAKGYRALPVYIKYSDDRTKIMELMKANKAERNLLFVIKKWESDTYTNIGLNYEIELNVFDENMIKLVSASIAEVKTIPGSAWDPPRAARREVPLAFKQVLENLLNDPKIQLAIQ
jgi:hypothetical protein